MFVSMHRIEPAVKRVLIMIPCYNEQDSLGGVLQEIAQLSLEGYVFDPLVINDASKDRTVEVARRHNSRYLDLPVNLGIGGAVQTGMKYAVRNNYELAIQLDGDGQHPPAEIMKLIALYESVGSDLVIGSRFLENIGFRSSFVRRLGIRYFYGLNRLLTGKRIYDSTSGFRLFGNKALQIGARSYPDDYPEPESLVMFAKQRLSVCEVPVIMRERQGGRSSIGHAASLYYCIKVTISMFFSYLRYGLGQHHIPFQKFFF